ncbi:hypothetical protein ES702_01076 [subsurface metagenome]
MRTPAPLPSFRPLRRGAVSAALWRVRISVIIRDLVCGL